MTPDLLSERLRAAMRDVPDFPRPGILFKDITPVLGDAVLYRAATEAMAEVHRGQGVTHVAGIESRGFLLAGPIAQHLGAGLLPLRKPGKLPARTHRVTYALEYGEDALEAHVDGCGEGARVLVVDDVLATGGTASAACALVEAIGGAVVGCAFLLELEFLEGRALLPGRPIHALVPV